MSKRSKSHTPEPPKRPRTRWSQRQAEKKSQKRSNDAEGGTQPPPKKKTEETETSPEQKTENASKSGNKQIASVVVSVMSAINSFLLFEINQISFLFPVSNTE